MSSTLAKAIVGLFCYFTGLALMLFAAFRFNTLAGLFIVGAFLYFSAVETSKAMQREQERRGQP